MSLMHIKMEMVEDENVHITGTREITVAVEKCFMVRVQKRF